MHTAKAAFRSIGQLFSGRTDTSNVGGTLTNHLGGEVSTSMQYDSYFAVTATERRPEC